jgi:hypothetical protein
MLNFYRHFLPNAASLQAPLHDILSGPKVKVSYPIPWSAGFVKAFEKCNASLSQVALLAYPDPTATLALVTDASTNAMGAVFQQQVQDIWQPLAFFSRKLNPAQQKYSAYDRELSMYKAVRHFCHMLEARHSVITDQNFQKIRIFQKFQNCQKFQHLQKINIFKNFKNSKIKTSMSKVQTPRSKVPSPKSKVQSPCNTSSTTTTIHHHIVNLHHQIHRQRYPHRQRHSPSPKAQVQRLKVKIASRMSPAPRSKSQGPK